MKIYKKAKIIEEVVNGHIKLYPLTKDGKKSKRRSSDWSFEVKTATVFSASTLANCSETRDKVYRSLSWVELGLLTRNFPNAIFVFEHDPILKDDYIYIFESKGGILKGRWIFMNFIVVDSLIISKAAKSNTTIHYPVRILPIIMGKSYQGNKVYVDAAAHEAILLEEQKYESGNGFIEFGGVFKKMYYIDTRTSETKNVRKFFDGVEL